MEHLSVKRQSTWLGLSASPVFWRLPWSRPLDAFVQIITSRKARFPPLIARRKRARFTARWSIQSPASRYMIRRMTMAGRSPLFAGTPSTTEPQIPLPLEATLRPIRISRCFMAVLPPICRKIPSLRKGLRREANATVCRFSNSMTCPPLKLRSTARALDRTLSTRPLNWNRPHSI